MSRTQEIRQLLLLDTDTVRLQAGEQLHVCDNLTALHEHMAASILADIEAHQERGARLILPVGPTGQYPLLAEKIKARELSLAGCRFFFMDEYCDEAGKSLPETHPLSFKRVAHEQFLNLLPDDCEIEDAMVIFPDESNITELSDMMQADGGLDACYGGIGIHGHVAFNEPEAGVKSSTARKVRLNDFTITINAIRAGVGGNLPGFPREAYTVGLEDILQARRIRLYCR
ncbi:MAG: 6-phosphogluconolactonase, partial [Aggregatilineales bacterium]